MFPEQIYSEQSNPERSNPERKNPKVSPYGSAFVNTETEVRGAERDFFSILMFSNFAFGIPTFGKSSFRPNNMIVRSLLVFL
jgi:hypothetical protein